jgi:hypothetical protein
MLVGFPPLSPVSGSTNKNRVEHTGGITEVAEKRDLNDVNGECIEGDGRAGIANCARCFERGKGVV